MTSWKAELQKTMSTRGETLADIEATTLTEEEMARAFDERCGFVEGAAFTAWAATTVYFPVVYDGFESVGSVSRHPDGKPTRHQGGGCILREEEEDECP